MSLVTEAQGAEVIRLLGLMVDVLQSLLPVVEASLELLICVGILVTLHIGYHIGKRQ